MNSQLTGKISLKFDFSSSLLKENFYNFTNNFTISQCWHFEYF